MAQLQIALLGGIETRLATGRVLGLPGQMAPALLAYLVARPARWHTREALCALLWPEVAATQARHRLRQTLLMLRRALAPGSRRWVTSTGEGIAVDPAEVEVDVVAFEDALAEGTPEALARAAGLYRGDFLAGLGEQADPFEEWVLSERERLRELGLEALGRLLAHQVGSGADGPAVQTATRLLALDGTQEAVHRTLMRLHARQGRRGAALRQYQGCVAALRRDLGVEPEPETREIYRALLRERPEAPGLAGRPAAATPGAPVSESLLGWEETPLVGREAERDQLRRGLEAAWSGSGQVAIVRGEAGIGKSRLAAETIRDALDHEGRAVVGRAHESQQVLPFGVWIEALRAAGVPEEIGGELAVSPAVRRELARLFPELGRAPAPTSQDHGRLFEALAALFAQLGQRQPLLVLVEDLQWADDMSLRFLTFLSRRLRGHPVLILATVREEDVATAPLLSSVIEELRGEPGTTVLRLGPLAREHVDALVGALTPARASADRAGLVERLWAESEGNPFVLVELVRVIREGVVSADASSLPLPERVQGAIAHRLGRLGERERHVVGAAAVIGREAAFPLLQRVSGLAERDVAEAAEQLVARGVLHVVGDQLDFVHDRVREVAYDRLLAPRRVALHEAAGRALEEIYGDQLDQVADRLAVHYSKAERAEKAITYLVRLAEKAARAYAHAEATTALREAGVHLERLPAGQARDCLSLDVALRLAEGLYFLGRFREGVDLLLGEEERLAALGDPSRAGPYNFWLSYLLTRLNEHERAVASARRAVAEGERCGDVATMGKAYGVLGVEAYWAGECPQSLEHGRRGVALLEPTGERWWLGMGYFNLGMTHLHMGQLEEALEAEARVQAIAQELDDPRLKSYGIGTTGWIHAARGDGAIAIDEIRRALGVAPDLVSRAYGAAILAYAHVEQGDHAQAIPVLEEVVERIGRFGARQFEGWFTAVLAEAYRLGGQPERARATALRGLSVSRESGNRHAAGWTQRTLGRIARADEAPEEAAAALTDALGSFEAAHARFEAARTRLDLAELCASRGDREEAARHLAGLAETFTVLGAPRYAERATAMAARLRAAPAGASWSGSLQHAESGDGSALR